MQLSEYQFYRDLGWQHQEIAKEMGIATATLYDWINQKYPKQERKDISELLRFMESSLLGDGSIVKSGSKSRFTMSSSNVTYLEYIRDELAKFGHKSNISYFKLTKEKSGYSKDCNIYNLKGRYSVLLNGLREKWYPSGVKRVPVGFEFTQQDIIRMYVEDGNLNRRHCEICWGVKDKESFEDFVNKCREFYKVLSVRHHKTGGWIVSLRGVEVLPGYEYKQAGVVE